MKLRNVAKGICMLSMAALLLSGCGEPAPKPATPEGTTAPVTTVPETTVPAAVYTVRFTLLEYIHIDSAVQEGMVPDLPQEIPEGLQILGWKDADGNEVDPFTQAVSGDVQYFAQAYPKLTNHVPYLQLDENGFLRPDDFLSASELQQALQALAAPGATDYFPGMPTGETVSAAQAVSVLRKFFPEEAVSAAFQSQSAITRAEFAVAMHSLLGRSDGELLTVAQNEQLPADITMEREDAICLLEAAVPHTPANDGDTWLQLELPSAYEPGFVNVGGWLYYVQQDKTLLRDGFVGELYFDASGRYTSGDLELDRMVAQILSDIQTAAPDAERMDWLRSAYEYCRDSFTYRRRNDPYAKGQTGWEIEDAKTMISTTKGNCYNFAAAFWALARGLGYEARAVSGTCLKDEQPHGWVFIAFDGVDYLFDPEWEYVYRYEREDYDKDMFMLPPEKIGWWNYRW